MKMYFLFVFIILCFLGNAQNTKNKISVAVKVGPIFTSYKSSFNRGIRNERYNEWNFELSIEENKKGFGFITRYIAAPGFIPNPIFQPTPFPAFDRNTVKIGDLVYRRQKFENLSFLLNKKVSLFNNKHRIDVASGMQLRKGILGYFSFYINGTELRATYEELDKYGFLSRIGYSYLINKHFSVSTNIEYSRFRKKPADFWDFNILAGVRF